MPSISDGDGRRDLMSSPADAIGSVANSAACTAQAQWTRISDTVRLEGTRYFWVEKRASVGAERTRTGAHWHLPVGTLNTDRRAALISFEGEDGPFYRLGYNNFYVITRYNRSKLFTPWRSSNSAINCARPARNNRKQKEP